MPAWVKIRSSRRGGLIRPSGCSRLALVAKVDLATRTLLTKVAVGVDPIQVLVTPDGRHVLATNQGTKETPSTTVSIIDTAFFTVVATVETGKGAHGVVIEPSSRFASISNIYADDVAVLDIAARKVVRTIPSVPIR